MREAKEKLPNWEYLKCNMYIVRTQAGFRQAVKHFWGEHAKGSDLKGYPEKFPSLVVLSEGYCGYSFVRANCIHLNDIAYALSRHADIFSES